jgi:hypothetical protein
MNDSMRATLTTLVCQFECEFINRHGYPAEGNAVEGPASKESIERLRSAFPTLPRELLDLYAEIGSISLPDLDQGYFLHSPDAVLQGIADGQPVGLEKADGERIPILCIGSDGGGAYYAVDLGHVGRILYLPPAMVERSTYFEGPMGVSVSADSVPELVRVWVSSIRAELGQ